MTDKLELDYVPLDTAMMWDNNQKRHDIGALVTSFKRHGFKDPPKFEPSLNQGKGAFVEGNGRTEALLMMKEQGEDPPLGILVDDEGRWLIPVLFGVDAAGEAAAEAYGIDHNSITLTGGDFGIYDQLRLYDAQFSDQLRQLAEQGEMPVTFDEGDLDAILDLPDFDEFPEEVPDLEDWDEPESAIRVIIQFDDQEQRREFMIALGLDPDNKSNSVRFTFEDLTLPEVADGL